jgi:hypothetical protein
MGFVEPRIPFMEMFIFSKGKEMHIIQSNYNTSVIYNNNDSNCNCHG